MSHLSNPLATATQLYQKPSQHTLPVELQDSILYHTARLTSAAGLLLRLPQDITAHANVLLFRYCLIEDILRHEFSDVSAAILYMTAKISSSPRSLRSITNVYTYLVSLPATYTSYFDGRGTAPDPNTYYLSDSSYHTFRNRILHLEGQVLAELGFNTHVALPYSLAVTYLQTLDLFNDSALGQRVSKKTIQYLNTALWSPQMLYLTHQPHSLATAAIYMASREEGAKLPDVEWWEVFDVDREELGFLCLGMGSLQAFVESDQARWEASIKSKVMLCLKDIESKLQEKGKRNGNGSAQAEDEEAEMDRLLDARVRE